MNFSDDFDECMGFLSRRYPLKINRIVYKVRSFEQAFFSIRIYTYINSQGF
jgi:hypothetical protein